jgi:hypothetical protein
MFLGNDGYDLSRGRNSYANPHHTIAARDIPTNLKQVMRLCRFYYNFDALLGAITDKMSEYPVTQIIIKERGGEENKLSAKDREKWETMINVVLNLRQVMIDINTDKYVYGNSFHYVYYPFTRYCICPACKGRTQIGAIKRLRAAPTQHGDKFSLLITATCPKCNAREVSMKVEDIKSEQRVGLRFQRLEPMRMELEYNPATGHQIWYWTPPSRLRDGLLAGDRTIIDYTELKILDAAHSQKKLCMNKDRLWVSQGNLQPGLWSGWGIPPIFRVLEDVYYYKILRRANEALAQEHVTPWRILSPAGTGDISPQRTMNLTDWQSRMKRELHNFRKDPNHIMVSPMPVAVEQVGGQARVMMVAAEMEAAARVIAAGVGCPIEMIWGGLNWSGASVSLRVLENHFLNDRENCERLLDFLGPKLATYFRLPRVTLRLSDFKMADDVQQQATAVNLMLQGFLSRKDVLPDMGYDPKDTFEALKTEHAELNAITMEDNMASAHMNIVIQDLEAKAQIMQQYELQHLQMNLSAMSERERLQNLSAHAKAMHQQGYAIPAEFDLSAKIIAKLPPQLQQRILASWQLTMPNMVSLLMAKMSMDGAQQQAISSVQANPQGAQSTGASENQNMAEGAAGPYDDGGDGAGGADLVSAGAGGGSDNGQQPLPSARPPRRSASPV